MRTIALSCLLFFAATETPFSVVADLASHLSQNNAPEAISAFDSHMKGYGELEQNIEALAAQTTVLCAIDVVDDTESEGAHKLDLDWYVQIKSQLDNSTERRRKRVQVEMRQIKGHWKITAMSGIGILDPIHIR